MATVEKGMTFEEYTKWDGLNQSSLKILTQQSPAHFNHARTAPQKDTPALTTGRLIHGLALDHAVVEKEFVISEYSDFRTKEAKEWRDKQTKTVIKEDEFLHARAVAAAVRESRLYKAVIGKSDLELSVQWEEMGLKFKARLDISCKEHALVADLKTTTSANPDKWTRDFWTYGYHFQAAFYSMAYRAAFGHDPKLFVFLAVEKDGPFVTAAFTVSPLAIKAGMEDIARAVAIYKDCTAKGMWPGYEKQQVDLPPYAQRLFPNVYTEEAPNG